MMKLWLLAIPALLVGSFLSTSALAAGSYYANGQALLKAKQYKAAAAAFTRAVAHKDHVALAYVGLGTADSDLGNYVAGFKAYQHAATLLPRNAEIAYFTAFAALYARAYDSSVSYATKAIALDPKSYAAYHMRFLAYGRLKNKKKQVADAHSEVKLGPKYPEAWNDYGIALGNDGQLPQSISAFGRAIALKPLYWAYYKNRGIVEVYNKQQSRALADFTKAEALAPDPADKKILAETAANLKKRMHH
jgi:tetratricopeptide (TPR) repeat protein